MNWQGEKYDVGNPFRHNTKWIIKQLREDFKQNFSNKLWKFSFSKERSSIHITIKQMPKHLLKEHAQVENYFESTMGNPDRDIKDETIKMIYDLANAYNYDNSDSMHDYYDRNYYLYVHLTNQRTLTPAKLI